MKRCVEAENTLGEKVPINSVALNKPFETKNRAAFPNNFGGKSNRFHAIARIEAAIDDAPRLETAIREILAAARVRALRWSDIDGARERFAAQRLFEYALREMRAGALRVEIEVRDRRGTPRVWHDTRSSPGLVAPNDGERTYQRDAGEFRTMSIRDVSPLSQLAGLFAGLVSFSYEKRDEYAAWLRRSGPQCALYSNEVAEFLPSKVSTERFQVLRHFLDLCDANGIAVSMEGARGLTTQGGLLLNARTQSANEPIDGARPLSAVFKHIRQSNGEPEPNRGSPSTLIPLQISLKVD